MTKILAFYLVSLATLTMVSSAMAAKPPEPVPLNGSYTRDLDRAKQTFNGQLNENTRPTKQIEEFSTVCNASGCIAQTPNLYTPPGTSKSIDYHWSNDRWELKAEHLFNCNDGSKVSAIFSEFFTPNGDGSFSGERSIQIGGKGCPGEGPGIYRLPFKLTPTK